MDVNVLIRTDHASLKYIKTQNNPDDQFARWVERLEEVRYTIEIRKGTKHCNADGLSRLPSDRCDGKRCICPGVAELEANGDVFDDWQTAGNLHEAVVNERVVACTYSESESDSSDDDETAVMTVEINAFRFYQSMDR